jgi:hypothetical protein
MRCLYNSLLSLNIGDYTLVGKVFKGFRFDPELYADFSGLVDRAHCTLTVAYEEFMRICVEREALVFPEKANVEGFEAEARVLVDWLGKGKRFYRGGNGEEVNIPGRLVWLLTRVRGAELRSAIEEQLKKSVIEQG